VQSDQAFLYQFGSIKSSKFQLALNKANGIFLSPPYSTLKNKAITLQKNFLLPGVKSYGHFYAEKE